VLTAMRSPVNGMPRGDFFFWTPAAGEGTIVECEILDFVWLWAILVRFMCV
jgi:hypothetical protein